MLKQRCDNCGLISVEGAKNAFTTFDELNYQGNKIGSKTYCATCILDYQERRKKGKTGFDQKVSREKEMQDWYKELPHQSKKN